MRTETRDRLVSGIGAAAVTGLLGVLLMAGLRAGPEAMRSAALSVIDVALPPPPKPPEPPEPVHAHRAAKAAGAPALKAKATPVVVPPPIIPLRAPPPVAVAPKPNIGAQAASGASSRAGVGTGAGGEGNGPGGGGDGGDGDDTPPRQIAGRLKFSDLPPDRRGDGSNWIVWVRYGVETDGRVDDCRITRSSGDGAVDAATCAAIERRFRFRPALDGNGRPFAAEVEEYHEWTIERGDD